MPTVTVSSKNQITIPVAVLRDLGVSPGDKMAVTLIDSDLVLTPEPSNWAQYFQGSMRGAYGGSKEAVDRYVLRERQSWYQAMSDENMQPDWREWREQFQDLYATDGVVRAVADSLLDRPNHAATLSELEDLTPGTTHYGSPPKPTTIAAYAIDRLMRKSWVRRVSPGDYSSPDCYRLDTEIAQTLKAA